MIVLQIIVYVLLYLELIISELHLSLEFKSCRSLRVEFQSLRIVFLLSVFDFKQRSAIIVTSRELF